MEDDRERLGFGKEVKNGCERGKRVLGLERKTRLVMKDRVLGLGGRKGWLWRRREYVQRVTKMWFLFCLRREMTLENNKKN